MEDNPQRQLLIVAMLFWIIPIVVLVISSILTLGLFGYYHSKIAIIFAAIIGILLIKFSIKKRPLELKDKILAGLAITAITLFQFPVYSMAAFYSQADMFVNLMRPVAAIIMLGVPLLLLAILLTSFGLHAKRYSLKQNIQSALTLLLAAFFFIVPIFVSSALIMMGPM
jgi:hypothetical protein